MITDRQLRLYLRGRRHGVLSAISLKFPDYPFGSVVPCVVDHAAKPTILISRLAEHTKNIVTNAEEIRAALKTMAQRCHGM